MPYLLWFFGNVCNFLLYFAVLRQRIRFPAVFYIQSASLALSLGQQSLFFMYGPDPFSAHWHVFDIADIAVRIAMFAALWESTDVLRIVGACYLLMAGIKCCEYRFAETGAPTVANQIYDHRIYLSVLLTFACSLVMYSDSHRVFPAGEKLERSE